MSTRTATGSGLSALRPSGRVLLSVPRADGAVVAEPPPAEWAALAEAGHEASRGWRFEVAGRPAREWRDRARAEILEAAAKATADMGDDAERVARLLSPAPGVVVATGHQPECYHPGVWVKNFLVQATCARRGFIGLNLVVDSDVPDSTHVPVPARVDGRWRRRPVRLPGARPGLPWESLPPLSDGDWRAFLHEAEASLEALDAASEALGNLRAFREVVLSSPAVLQARTMAESLSRARREWEASGGQPPSYLELPLSSLCRTRSFIEFAAWLLAEPDAWWARINGALHRERRRQEIRSDANPVPDLRRRDDLWETPLWCLHPTRERRGVFTLGSRGHWLLQSRDVDFFEFGSDATALADGLYPVFGPGGRYALRPRALTLTLFMRLAACDLFVHGLGGAHYECVNDQILADLAIPAPAWASASATLLVRASGRPDPPEPVRDLERLLRDTAWNPQRFLAHLDEGVAAEAQALAARKQALIETLRSLPRGTRAPATREIRALNAHMARLLGPFRQQVRTRRDQSLARRQEEEAALFRGYPFFLHSPGAVEQLVRPLT